MDTGPLFVAVFGLKTSDIARADTALLCLHGIEAHGTRFIRLAELLPAATVVAPDLRGHGRSPKHGPYTVDQNVRDLAPLLRRIGPRAVIVGHSYGGLLAWELARYAHDQLRALVLVDPAIGIRPVIAADEAALAAAPVRWPDAETAFATLMGGRDPRSAWSVALDIAVGTEVGDDGTLRPRVAPEAVQAAWAQMAEPLHDSPWRGPTLLVEAAGAAGRFTTPALIEGLRVELGDRLEHVVVDAPHTITSDAPELLAEQLEAFLERLGR